MIRQFRHWCDIARQNIFRLAIKTGYPDSVKEFVRLIQEIDHSHVGATIDVEHQKNYTELLARVNSADKGTSPTFSPVFDFGAVDQFRMDLGRGDMALGSGSEQRLGQERQIRG